MDIKQLHLEDYLKRRQDYISNLQGSYNLNQTEIYKNLFALAVVGFGYNLAYIDQLTSKVAYALWLLTAFGLGVSVGCCFFVFSTTSSIQNILIELRVGEFEEDQRENGKREERKDNKIKWLNRYQFMAFVSFMVSMVLILVQAILFSLK